MSANHSPEWWMEKCSQVSHLFTLSCAPHDLIESNSNFPFQTFRISRSIRAPNAGVSYQLLSKTERLQSWNHVRTDNHVRMASINQDCPRQTRLYDHPIFEVFIRKVIQTTNSSNNKERKEKSFIVVSVIMGQGSGQTCLGWILT